MSTQIEQVQTVEQTGPRTRGVIKIEPSLMERAKNNEFEAIQKMFQQFLPENEAVLAAEYLGIKGLWGFGTSSFACVTHRRVASIQTGLFGEVVFQDGCMEYINSGIIYQPSKFGLYVLYLGLAFFALFTFGFGLLLAPFSVKAYYNLNKCGVVFVIREGVSVYAFTDRDRLIIANRLYRMVMQAREIRIREIGLGI